MSALRRLALGRRPLIASGAVARRAGLHSSAVRCAGKESALHQEGRAEDIQREKAESLERQKEGKGEWKDGLASDSESIVKADRGEIDASGETVKKLQEETKRVAGKK